MGAPYPPPIHERHPDLGGSRLDTLHFNPRLASLRGDGLSETKDIPNGKKK